MLIVIIAFIRTTCTALRQTENKAHNRVSCTRVKRPHFYHANYLRKVMNGLHAQNTMWFANNISGIFTPVK